MPSHREANLAPLTLNKLNDGAATTLSDTPIGTVIGPGNVTWAYQWDFLLQPGGTFQISKDKQITPVPEPAAISLLIILSGILFARYRGR